MFRDKGLERNPVKKSGGTQMLRSGLRPLAPGEVDTWEIFTRGLSRVFGQDAASPYNLGPLLIGFAVLLATALVVGLIVARCRRRSLHSPKRLFLTLCRAHRLSWKQTWLLWQLARAQGLENAALLFVDPDRFDPDYIGLWLRPQQQALLEVRKRIFAGLNGKTATAEGGVDVGTVLRDLPASRSVGAHV